MVQLCLTTQASVGGGSPHVERSKALNTPPKSRRTCLLEGDEEERHGASVNNKISLIKLHAVVQVNVKWNINKLAFQITCSC